MKLRAPAIPLITIDPYFSVWSANETLNFSTTKHWTGKEQSIRGTLIIDGKEKSFLGYQRECSKMVQTEMDIDALSTRATFEGGGIRLYVKFTSPLLIDNLDIMTRPVSYLSLSYESIDDKEHTVELKISCSSQLCLDGGKESPIVHEEFATASVKGIRMGNSVQKILNRSGDDLRIDWGYFYLGIKSNSVKCEYEDKPAHHAPKIIAKSALTENEESLVLFAYDDIKSIDYFGDHLTSYWNKDGKTVLEAIEEAACDYQQTCLACDNFSDKLCAEAYMAGGEKYADILSLAFRQVIAAHKVAVGKDGEILFISKECFSNGCAATVDVSYPSTPMFLRYNTELVKGMMRPIYKYASTDEWTFDFAPHDAGQYPLVTGQVYGKNRTTGEQQYHMQMPVEECGNMIVMEANVALADGNADFANEHIDVLKAWCEYLIKYGDDPENQLCTDDFAGHLAHNCNLTLKAIVGIMGMSIICNMLGMKEDADKYEAIAREKACGWVKRAANPDGSFKLAFDREGSFSMKYNMVWDKIWNTNLFPKEVYESEIASNFEKFNKYGMPLDSRSDYTKSDWLVWTATMTSTKTEFKKFITPLWNCYNESPSRVPMTDWYDTVSGLLVGFIHRTVQGGLYIKMLDESGMLKYEK